MTATLMMALEYDCYSYESMTVTHMMALEYDCYYYDDIREYLPSSVAMRMLPAGFVLLWMTCILFCLYSNHSCVMTKPPMPKAFSQRQLPNNSVAKQLAEFLEKRSRSLTHLDSQDLLDLRSNNHLDFNCSEGRLYHHSNINEMKQCSKSTPKSRRSSRETEEGPHHVPKKCCSSGDSRHSIGGHRVGRDSSHRYSEASSFSDMDSLRCRYFGYNHRHSNCSIATTVQTTLSSSVELETAVDLAENLMVKLFDTDDVDGIIPARFLQENQDAIVDNIREEEYAISHSPTASCDQSSFDDDFLPHSSFAGESTSEIRFSSILSPHNTSTPRSSRHSKSSSPERLEPVSSYPIEGGMPHTSIWSMINTQLDTIEEERASQISPTPRVMSPCISFDNGGSFDVVADLQSKPTQPTTHRLSVPYMRKISLQRDHQRKHHRFSVESPVSENSFYFSVTPFDDDIVSKMEMIDDQMPLPIPSPKLDRRQRMVSMVSTPNSTVLQWLANMPKEPLQSLDPDEPWPFNKDVTTSTTTSEVAMEILTVPERRISPSETSDLDSFHSCCDDYAASDISGQDSFDCTQLDVNHNDQIMDQGDDQDKDETLHREMTLDQQSAHRRQRLKQQQAFDFDY